VSGRRLNGEGSIVRRSDGRWMGRLADNGKRVAVYGKSREEARRKLRTLQRKQDAGEPLSTSRTPLAQYFAQWLESIKSRVRPKTLEDYAILVRCHLVPALGHIPLGKLSPEHVDRVWAKMLQQGTSPSVVQHCHLRLSKALADAMKRELIFRNPCQVVSPPKPQKKPLHAPDAAAIHKLLEAARPTDYYEVIHTALFTGLRRNELLALRWRDADLEEGSLSVGWSIYRAKGGKTLYQVPKTDKSRRTVALTPSSILVLQALREKQEADGRLLGY
jgi:integrase